MKTHANHVGQLYVFIMVIHFYGKEGRDGRSARNAADDRGRTYLQQYLYYIKIEYQTIVKFEVRRHIIIDHSK